MTRYHLRIFSVGACVTTLVALAGCWSGTARQQAPASEQRAATTAPIVIAVLADRFTSAEREDFDDAVGNFFRYGLLADRDFSAHAKSIAIVPIFQAWSGTSQTPSNYGFQVIAGSTPCSVTWTDDTPRLLDAAVGNLNPERTVIIGNYGYNLGCAKDDWTYIAAGAVGRKVLEHEFGHLLAGLHDEYYPTLHATEQHPFAVDDRNCSTNVKEPHWVRACTEKDHRNARREHAPMPVGCNLYGLGIVRPSNSCRMGAGTSSFCYVCREAMEDAFEYFAHLDTSKRPIKCEWGKEQTWTTLESAGHRPPAPATSRFSAASLFAASQPAEPPSRAPVRLVRVRVRVTADTATVKSVSDATGVFTPALRRLGTYAYEITDGGKPLATGVLVGDPLIARDYRGGGQRHEAAPTDSADVVVRISGETVQSLRETGRNVQVTFYRLGPDVASPMITPDELASLKERTGTRAIATISAADLREAPRVLQR